MIAGLAGGLAAGRSDAGCSYEVYRDTGFFGSLNGLRCIAILAVIWVYTGVGIDNLLLAQRAYLGVDLFFAISGFLITTLLLRERDRYGAISLRAFYIRRSLRIFPLYYTVIVLYVAFVWMLEPSTPSGRKFFDNLPYFLTYTSNWFVPLEGRVIFYFAWSLATEEQFYLVWPTVEKFLRGWRAAWVIGGLMLLRALVASAVHGGVLTVDPLWVRVVLSIHPAILGGVLLAHVLHDRRGFELISPVLRNRWAAPVALAGLLVSIEAGLPMGVIWGLMVALVGCAVIRESNGLAAILGWRPIAHIGVVSYGMYLLHMLSFHAAKRMLAAIGLDHEWLWFPATVVAATLAASLSYRYYESWFLRLKDNYSRGGARVPARAATRGDAGANLRQPEGPRMPSDSTIQYGREAPGNDVGRQRTGGST